MPRVPTYDQLQVAPTSLPGARLSPGQMQDFSGRQAQEAGRAMQQAGGDMGRIALDMQNEANRVRVTDATNQLVAADTALSVEATQILGRNALERPDGLSLPDEYGKKLSDSAAEIEKGLANDAQKLAFREVSARVSQRFNERVTGHMVKQQGAVREETWKTTISTAQERGMLLWGDEPERQASLGAIRATVDEMGATLGLDQASRDRMFTEAASPMHAGIIKSMILADRPDMAKEYYEANSAGMTMQARAQVQGHIVEAAATKAGEEAVDTVWQAMGPQDPNDAVSLFDMDKQLREQLADQPGALKHARAALRERATLFNQQQAELTAAGVNEVYAQVGQGVPMSTIRRTEAWLNLPAKTRDQIQDDLRNDAYTDLQKRVAMRTLQEKENVRNSGDYLTYSDPTVLSKLSRGQVEALRPRFGFDATQALVKKWDDLQKPGRLADAKMDTEDFNAVADRLGFKPYAKGESNKAKLGELKFRVEQLIDRKQAEAGRTLDRQEKMQLMEQEMARKVLVDRFGPDREVPVINLTPGDVEKVVVPADARATIAAKMQARYQKTQDPRFAPTEENLRYWYLRSQSPAADLIKQGQ